MRSDQVCSVTRNKAVLYWILAILMPIVFVIKGWQVMPLGWLLLFEGIAYEDLKSKSYPLYIGIAFMVYSMLLRILSGEVGSVFLDLYVGVALVGIAWAFRRHIGLGDTVVILGIILAWGVRVSGNGLFLAAVCGGVQYFIRQDAVRRDEVAFTPLLLIGFMVQALMA